MITVTVSTGGKVIWDRDLPSESTGRGYMVYLPGIGRRFRQTKREAEKLIRMYKDKVTAGD